jgi:hypothetical protein
LHLLLSVQHHRMVRNDFCISFLSKRLQLPPSVPPTLARRRVVVHTFLDGTLGVSSKGRLLATFNADGVPLRMPEAASPTTTANQPRPSPAEPSWRSPGPSEIDLGRFTNNSNYAKKGRFAHPLSLQAFNPSGTKGGDIYEPYGG